MSAVRLQALAQQMKPNDHQIHRYQLSHDASTAVLQPQHKVSSYYFRTVKADQLLVPASVVNSATASIDNEFDKYLQYVSTLTDMGSECGLDFWLQWRGADRSSG